MTIPLILLSIPACIAGFPFIASIFIKVPEHEGSPIGSMAVSLIAFAAGAASGYYLYKEKTRDSIQIPLFEHKFYIDEMYGSLIKWTQDLLANISGFVDRWVIDGDIVRGLGGINLGRWVRPAFPSGRQPTGVRVSLRSRGSIAALLHPVRYKMNFLVHLIYLSPLVAGVGIIFGLPARRTAITAAVVAIISALIVFIGYDRATGGYQFASFVHACGGLGPEFCSRGGRP